MDSKVILITGGSRGIGQALAVSLANFGHLIAVTGRKLERLEATANLLPDNSLILEVDVSDESAMAAAIERVIDHFGRLDVLINNAGTAGPGGPTWTASCEDWWKVHETNVKGPLVCINKVLPHMISRNSGIIINIGSYAAIRPTPGNSAYASSKAALARITDSIAAELVDYRIQIFCLSPGLVRTEMTKGVPVFDDIPDHKWNKADDVCRAVNELLTGKHENLSGRFLRVNDDIEELEANLSKIVSDRLYQLRMDNLKGPLM
jgi:NADP-dependent 3-hydroxy acid dehydrogenase YdfG